MSTTGSGHGERLAEQIQENRKWLLCGGSAMYFVSSATVLADPAIPGLRAVALIIALLCAVVVYLTLGQILVQWGFEVTGR